MKTLAQAIILFSCLLAHGQSSLKALAPSDPILISDIKTTHLIFDDKISYLDVGSPYFIADTVRTMVKIRHIGDDAQNALGAKTNVTVITEDGTYYSIPLVYNRDASKLSFKVGKGPEKIAKSKTEIQQEKEELADIHEFAKKVSEMRPNYLKFEKRQDFEIGITGIFYDKDLIGLRLVVNNNSAIDLDIDHILARLQLKKRVASDFIYQERVIKPIGVVDWVKRVYGQSSNTMLLVFERFTPNENERLTIDVLEQGGGRTAKVIIPRKKLIHPKALKS